MQRTNVQLMVQMECYTFETAIKKLNVISLIDTDKKFLDTSWDVKIRPNFLIASTGFVVHQEHTHKFSLFKNMQNVKSNLLFILRAYSQWTREKGL